MSTVTVLPSPSPAMLLPRPAAPGREFDVASEISGDAVAWRIRDLATGEQEQFLWARVRGEEVLPRLVTEVSEWAAARAGDEPITLRCFSIALRDAMAQALDPDRFPPADLITLNTSAQWAGDARASLRSALEAHSHQLYLDRVLYAATDGSAHPRKGDGAYAWVTSSGEWFTKRSHASILLSEVMAILALTRTFLKEATHYRAVVFVDSLNAINALTSREYLDRRIDPHLWGQTRALIESGRLELVWVRSHQGHLLNDLADRLALNRYRATRSKLDEEQLNALCEQIVDGAAAELAGTDWATEAQRAREAHRAHIRAHDQAA